MKKILILFLFLFLSLNGQEDSRFEYKPLVLDKEYEVKLSSNKDKQIIYDLVIIKNTKGKNKTDFFVVAKGESEYVTPFIYLTTDKDKLLNDQQPEYICYSHHLDICTIPQNEIKENTTYYVLVNCTQPPCALNFSAYYKKEKKVKINEKYFFTTTHKQKEQLQYIDLEVPKRIANDPNPYTGILVTAEIMDVYITDDQVQIFLSKSPKLPTKSDYLIKGEYIVWQGEGLVIQGDNLCDNCNYMVGIEAGIDAKILFSAITIGNHREIQINKQYNDIRSQYNQNSTYFLNLKKLSLNKDSNLLFEIRQAYGDADMYITCENKYPKLLKDYQWKSESTGDESIVISKQEIDNCPQKDELKVFVYCRWECSYYLAAQYYLQKIYLRIDETLNADIYDKQILNYKVVFENQDKLEILFNLESYSNDYAIYFMAKICQDLTKCQFEKKEMEEYVSDKTKIPFNYHHTMIDIKKQVYSFKQNKSLCNINKQYCHYAIGVYGVKIHGDEKFASFLIKPHVPSKLSPLKEGIPTHWFVYQNQVHRYYFQYFDDGSVANVIYQLTTVQGRLILAVDENIMDVTNFYSQKFQHKSYYGHIVVNTTNKNPSNSIKSQYIYIFGETFAAYIISAVITRVDKINNQTIKSYILLEKDHFQDVYLKKEEDFFFEIYLRQKSNITINLKPLQGDFDIFLGLSKKNPPTNYKEALWTNVHNISSYIPYQNHSGFYEKYHISKNGLLHSSTLYISEKDKNYPERKQKFYGRVVLRDKEKYDKMNSSLKFNFQITYHTDYSLHTLYEGKTHKGYLLNNDYDEFKFQVEDKSTYKVSLNTNVKEKSNVKVILSQLSNSLFIEKFPDRELTVYEQHTFQNKSFQFNSSILKRDETSKAWIDRVKCTFEKGQKCYVYFLVQSSITATYSITVKKIKGDTDPTQIQYYELFKGIETYASFPQKDDKEYFIYRIPLKDSFTFTLQSNQIGYLETYIKMIEFNKENKLLIKNFPSKENNDFILYSHLNNFASFTGNDTTAFKFCKERPDKCYFIAAVFNIGLNNISQAQLTALIKENNQQMLSESQPIYDYIKKDEWKYYSINVGKQNQSLTIILQSMEGTSVVLYASYGKKPTKEDHDYYGSFYRQERIEINRIEVKQGLYIVGVKGVKNGSYNLQYVIGEYKFFSVSNNYPVNFEAIAEEKLFFKYTHYYNESFNVIINKIYGKITVGIDKISQYNITSFIEKKAKRCNVFEINGEENKAFNYQVIEPSKKKNFLCYGCEYYITICSQSVFKGSIFVIVDNQPIYMEHNIPLMNQAVKGNLQNYSFYYSEDFALRIHNYIGQISVSVSYYFYGERTSITDVILNREKTIISVYTTNYIEKLKKKYNHRSIYYSIIFVIEIKAISEKAVYQIQTLSAQENHYLLQDSPQQIQLNNHSSQVFEFEFDKDAQQVKQFYVEVFVKNQPQNNGKQLKPVQVDVKFQKDNIHQFQNVECNNKVPNNQIFSCLIQTNDDNVDFYVITLTNNNAFNIDTILLVKVNDLNLLLPKFNFYNTYKPDQNEWFQIFLDSDSKALVQVDQCVGKVELIVSQDNLQEQTDSIISVEAALGPQNDIAKIINFKDTYNGKNNIIYLKVNPLQANEDQQNKDISYQIHYQIFNKQDKLSNNKFSLPDNGIIKSSQIDDNLLIEFGQVQCISNNCVNFLNNMGQTQSISITYYIFFGENHEKAHSMAHCGEHIDQDDSKLISKFSQTIVYNQDIYQKEEIVGLLKRRVFNSFKVPVADVKVDLIFHVQVLAEILYQQKDKDDYFFKIYYNPLESKLLKIGEGGAGSNNSTGWIIALTVIIVALTIVLFFIFRRYRLVESTLKNEMTDVRNIVGENEGESYKEKIQFNKMTDEQ